MTAMSDRPVVPEQDNGDWRRWKMDELNTAQRKRPEQGQREDSRQEAIRQQLFKRNAELEAVREKAREEAYETAYREGFEQGKQTGFDQGLVEGRAAGEQEWQQQAQKTLHPLQPLAERFCEALKALDDEIAERLVDLALTTGRQLAGEALEAHPEEVLAIVRELLHVEPALSGRPRLWLHPADLALVKAHLGSELEAAGWQLQPDDLISRGGCRASSASGELDATLESRWAAIVSQVRRRHRSGPRDGAP